MGAIEPLETRFWKYIDPSTDGCWNWHRKMEPRTYCTIKVDRSRCNRYVHHVSWEIHYGPIPDGLFVLHRCDNPRCVRPDHLFLGTNSDNMKDCSQKGRINGCTTMSWHGELSPKSKLTWDAVTDIRTNGDSLTTLAARYGVTKGTIWKVRMNMVWSEVARPISY